MPISTKFILLKMPISTKFISPKCRFPPNLIEKRTFLDHEFHEFSLIQRVCFEIFGCARHSPNKFGPALTCAKIREISATDQVAILLIERD